MATLARGALGATIRSDNGAELKIKQGAVLQEFAIRWSYLIRNRSHWSMADVTKMSQLLQKEVRRLGFNDEQLRPLTTASLIEVEIPYKLESENWESRIMPWELVLTRAFSRSPDAPPPIVVRRLKLKSRSSGATAGWTRPLAYIESAPGKLGEAYSFARERTSVAHSLAGSRWTGRKIELINPSLEDIKSTLHRVKPWIVHIAGVDNHQGAELLGEHTSRFNDGMYLKSNRNSRQLQVSASELATAIGDARPGLVGLNLYHSAPRIAPLILASGAQSVVAFQDTIDDMLAEIFFAEFYSKWVDDETRAFQDSLSAIMRGGTPLAGAGIVYWNANSLLPRASATRTRITAEAEQLKTGSKLEYFRPVTDGAFEWEKHLVIKIEPRSEINYSLLHNGRSLFKQFYVHNRTGKRLDNLQVRVVLSLGDQCLEQTKRFSMSGAGIDLRTELPLSLISSQLRRFKEAVNTSLKISIDWLGNLVLDHNYVLRILPINEWNDTDDERHWLPSFVQPRDPAIGKIKDRAKLWLKRLTSDHASGFDGYQQVDDVKEESWVAVTHQVEAIWDALAYDCALLYTNPPPTYTTGSQRIRTPSEILESRTGTCLDLTVLLAACLEEIDIYPVIFLLDGHAFPGYWQTPMAQSKFWGGWEEAVVEKLDRAADFSERGRMDAQDAKFQWMLNKLGYDHILDAIHHGYLVPLESVWLTSEKKLEQAIDAGGENLVDRREFACMIDVVRARQKNVLPLPEVN